jgi:hypothetical protein
VGSLRESFENPDAAHRLLSRTGMAIISNDEDDEYDDEDSASGFDEDDVSSDAIHAALEKSQLDSSHGPLVLKENKPKRRNFPRKKKV